MSSSTFQIPLLSTLPTSLLLRSSWLNHKSNSKSKSCKSLAQNYGCQRLRGYMGTTSLVQSRWSPSFLSIRVSSRRRPPCAVLSHSFPSLPSTMLLLINEKNAESSTMHHTTDRPRPAMEWQYRPHGVNICYVALTH